MLSLNGSTIIFQIINFAVLLAVLGWFFYRPLQRVMRQREEAITNSIAEAEKRAAEAAAERDRLAAEREQAREEHEEALAEARAEAARLTQAAEAKAHEEATRLLDEAARRIAENERAASAQLAEEARTVAVDVAGAVAKRIAGPAMHDSLVDAFLKFDFSGDSEQAQALRTAFGQDSREVVVESAYPVTPELEARLRSALDQVRGAPASVKVVVDESLLAGLRVVAGTMAVDFSLKRILEDLRESAESSLSEDTRG